MTSSSIKIFHGSSQRKVGNTSIGIVGFSDLTCINHLTVAIAKSNYYNLFLLEINRQKILTVFDFIIARNCTYCFTICMHASLNLLLKPYEDPDGAVCDV